jgi:type III secretory pathway component EscU
MDDLGRAFGLAILAALVLFAVSLNIVERRRRSKMSQKEIEREDKDIDHDLSIW